MTPSPGLEASADYVAGQFRAVGLTPGGFPNSTFFQTAAFTQVSPQLDDFQMTLVAGARRASIGGSSVRVRTLTAIDVQNEAVVWLAGDPAKVTLSPVAGRVVQGGEAYDNDTALRALGARKPALILLRIDGSRPKEDGPLLMEADSTAPPVIRIYNRAGRSLLTGQGELRVTLHVKAPVRHDVALRNVAGILRGSDPALRDQFVIVSAHYDHLGIKPPGPGNQIFHGANDDASGVASLVEIAKALGAGVHPKRSVLFLALFGEEEGLLGSAYYVRHPLIPLARTVADINMEQLGRTDSSDGPEIAKFALTGPSYSNLQEMMGPAAKIAGAEVYRKDNADEYFDRSDNYSFALAGVVAHTVVVAFEFPDYHAVSDEADKLDYGNLALVDRGIAAGVAAVANAVDAPKWSDAKGAIAFRASRQ